MATRNVVLYPDNPLLRVATPYAKVGPEVAGLAEDMLETMYASEGCGLAGPQVGVSRRIFVLHDPESDTRMCLVNPEILKQEGEAVGSEGCLSIPEIYADVARATWIQVRALDRHGMPLEFEARDYLARIILHEYDHLEGITIFDRIDVLTRHALLQDWEKVRERLTTGVFVERS